MRKLNLGRFKAVFGACVGIVMVSLVLAYIYRDDIFQTIQDPGQPFQTYEPPAAADYSLLESWLAQPDLGIDPFTLLAKGDVFVVVPSVYRGGAHWNLPSDDFFMTNREDAQHAQDFAYQDVKRAFKIFLEQSPPERPMVLVGHNQGASHVQRLLMDFFQGDLKKRLAVAYVIDHPLPLASFEGPLSNLTPCDKPEQTQCIVAFGSFTPKDKVIAQRFSERTLVHFGHNLRIMHLRAYILAAWQQKVWILIWFQPP